ncbi:grpIintron_endo, group I intron endonuclease [uncultured Caudovirales phage]|uniref:GrpIintron_endo, group I intron endonuclease n=1 Tax=uncultured Caudovirales phage TaxID=2100421 RepID=A0A6J5LC29_9CAUD|nr:grpIintron_endo, group I intron endonuclease [uncultured Caudovirales phage]
MQAYLIRNKINGKGYIGITTRSIERRWYEHRFVENSCGKLLSKSIKKYGEEFFEITVLASAIDCVENLKELEKQLISQNNTVVPLGYNLTSGGDGVFGFKHSKESIERMSAQRRGKKQSESTKQKMHEAHLGEKNHFFGKIHSEDTKKNISKTKQGCAGPWLGKPRSEETKRKISEALKGRPGRKHTDEAKAKLSAAHTGKKQKPPTDETKKKLSESVKVSWIKRKQSQKGN